MKKDDRGRPPVDIDLIAQKLEPYLKMGLAISKACTLVEGVSRNTVSKYYKEDDNFRAKILAFRAYKSVLMGNITMAKLIDLSNAVAQASKNGLSLRSVITKNDYQFLLMLMRYDKSLRDEWGDKLTDKNDETEDKVQFDQPKNEREADLMARVLNKHHDYINKGRDVEEGDLEFT